MYQFIQSLLEFYVADSVVLAKNFICFFFHRCYGKTGTECLVNWSIIFFFADKETEEPEDLRISYLRSHSYQGFMLRPCSSHHIQTRLCLPCGQAAYFIAKGQACVRIL